MNQHLQTILDFIQQNEKLTAEEKNDLAKAVKKVSSDLDISEFKLERTEKVKRTTAILLEETIEELEQKRKAVEAQNRELEIESALERVRTVAMGMNKADDLLGICEVLFKELQKLGFADLRNAMINIHNDERESFLNYDYSDFAGAVIAEVNYNIYHSVKTLVEQARSSRDAFIEYAYTGKELEDWKAFRKQGGEYDDPRVENISALYYYFYSIGIGSIGISAFSAIGAERLELLKRFRNVFDLAYRRYVDITKAEAQAREAQIEASLEKVRSRTMAMQRSDELSDTAAILFQEFKRFGEEDLLQITIGIYNEAESQIEFRVTSWAAGGEGINRPFNLSIDEPTLLKPVFTAWKENKKSIVIDLEGQQLEDWLTYRNANTGVTVTSQDTGGHRVVSVAFFSKGHISISAPHPSSKETIRLLERFAAVFDGTYTRFLDLQKAEAQAKEAIKQASLDRVRGQIASMRSTEDLQRITPIIWQELTHMDIPFIRCGVFIIHEANAIVEAHLASPDGHSLGALHLDFDASEVTKNTVTNWRKKEVYHQHWNKEEFLQWTQTLIEQGQVQNQQSYQGATAPPESLDLHFVPFTQGMLYVGNIVPLTADELSLVQSLADAFAIAYARYEDFNKLEKAKESIERTLSELKAAQAQLIQSEKMASLGELTAGIAHEIQNPLNFVNNFSEVSKELLDEMKLAMDKGDADEVKEIANDVIQNLEKILHHGKRAEGIVKGMLQHSRSSTATKEPTDINKLADEYLRLAYHGLRAKDKSFNATLHTDYDDSIGNINIIPQDIGRVILNLITNAFYVVDEKKKSGIEGYEPTVSVSTKKIGDIVLISVKDNGNGIPQKVLDKIFQPFFTTKPTGQGTGLGLSLSYDIVKAHGGELKVETKEGERTEFIIHLPMG